MLYDEHLVRSPLLLLVVMLFILGMQSIMMGLIAELLARTYHESQAKPTYTIRRVLNRPATRHDPPSPAGRGRRLVRIVGTALGLLLSST